MKRIATALTVLSLLAGGSVLLAGSRSIATLRKALQNEREAQALYLACAEKAEEEGLAGAASLFRASARAEEIHGNRFASLLKDRATVPTIEVAPPHVENTEHNLNAAARAERIEVESTYRTLAEEALQDGDKEASACLELARTTEIEHLNLYVALANSRDPTALKEARTYHVCQACGYTTDAPLRGCPACKAGKFVDIR